MLANDISRCSTRVPRSLSHNSPAHRTPYSRFSNRVRIILQTWTFHCLINIARFPLTSHSIRSTDIFDERRRVIWSNWSKSETWHETIEALARVHLCIANIHTFASRIETVEYYNEREDTAWFVSNEKRTWKWQTAGRIARFYLNHRLAEASTILQNISKDIVVPSAINSCVACVLSSRDTEKRWYFTKVWIVRENVSKLRRYQNDQVAVVCRNCSSSTWPRYSGRSFENLVESTCSLICMDMHVTRCGERKRDTTRGRRDGRQIRGILRDTKAAGS